MFINLPETFDPMVDYFSIDQNVWTGYPGERGASLAGNSSELSTGQSHVVVENLVESVCSWCVNVDKFMGSNSQLPAAEG